MWHRAWLWGQRLESNFQDPKPCVVSLISGQNRRSWGREDGLQPDVNLPIVAQEEWTVTSGAGGVLSNVINLSYAILLIELKKWAWDNREVTLHLHEPPLISAFSHFFLAPHTECFTHWLLLACASLLHLFIYFFPPPFLFVLSFLSFLHNALLTILVPVPYPTISGNLQYPTFLEHFPFHLGLGSWQIPELVGPEGQEK